MTSRLTSSRVRIRPSTIAALSCSSGLMYRNAMVALDEQTGEIHFIEINVNCNLWSQKTIATAARCIGVCHQELIETIVCHSMMRQGLLARAQVRAA